MTKNIFCREFEKNMFLGRNENYKNTTPAEIVNTDYRTAEVFLQYGIDFCTDNLTTLSSICYNMGIDEESIIRELDKSQISMNVSGTLNYADWNIGFLTDYIENIHHYYLRTALPVLDHYIQQVATDNTEKPTNFEELQRAFKVFSKNMLEHLLYEEETIFPYIRQIGNAFYRKESYASLFVRTLRKPVEEIMDNEHHSTTMSLERFRLLSLNYSLTKQAPLIQKVMYAKLKELDNNLVLHLYLENDVLFPKALIMEKELLQQVG